MNSQKSRKNNNPASSYIFLGVLDIVGLSIIIWQLFCLHFYDKPNYYFGLSIIFIYHIILLGLFSATRRFRYKRLINNILFSLSLIVMIAGVGLIPALGQILNVPAILFFITYILAPFLIAFIFMILGWITF